MKLLCKSKGFLIVLNMLQPATIMTARNQPEGHTIGHYIVHTVVQGVGGVAIGGASALGTMAGIGMAAAAPREPIALMAGMATVLGSLGGGIYSMYRLPQWTDRYFLGYETERNRTQNIVCFLSKVFLAGWPVGVWAGEFVAHLDGIATE